MTRTATPGPTRSGRGERGETLVESLIAMVIVAIAGTSVIGALASSLTSSTEHRNIAAIDTLLKSYAETVRYQVELEPAPALYADCPSTGISTGANALTHYTSGLTWTYPAGYTSGYTVQVTKVEMWNSISNAWDNPAGACPTADANGLERLSLSATHGTVTDTMQIVVRNPAFVQAEANSVF
jgi:type II secretory pathway pseudopilin PulG